MDENRSGRCGVEAVLSGKRRIERYIEDLACLRSATERWRDSTFYQPQSLFGSWLARNPESKWEKFARKERILVSATLSRRREPQQSCDVVKEASAGEMIRSRTWKLSYLQAVEPLFAGWYLPLQCLR